jgi:hypothetical protein
LWKVLRILWDINALNKLVAFNRGKTRTKKIKRGAKGLYDSDFIITFDASLKTVVIVSENCHYKN